MEKISVAIRFRPSAIDNASNSRFWKVEDNSISLHRSQSSPISGVSFTFDHVFDQSCSNLTVYNVLTKSIIDAAIDGFNGTAFAYGQTSSGKTFTMNGSKDDPGIIQLAVNDIFCGTEKIKEREFLIRVSYMEIYNEEINDLLSVENQKLPIHESLDRGIFVAGLREEIVDSAAQVSELLTLGEANRHFGETNMNVRSSRSHTIFRMVIESRAKDPESDLPGSDSIRVSVLNLVDLAGSERIAKTGADGVRLKEGKHINKSLMTLGNVINRLSDGGRQRGHIPYRDSKLTRILQPALGGNAKTSIICTVAPEELHVEETRGTLQFASRAKRITNCAQVNEILTDAALLKRQKQEIEELRRKLQGSHAEVLEQVLLKQRNDMLKSELEREKLAMQLEEEKRMREALENQVKDLQMKIDLVQGCDDSDNSGSRTPNLGILPNEFVARRPNSLENQVKDLQMKIDLVQGCDDSDNSGSRTPNLGILPNEFVARRPNYSKASDSCSPVPDTLGDKADEDMWMQLNKGFATDLSMLQMTPTMETQTLLSPCKGQKYPDKEQTKALEEALEKCHILTESLAISNEEAQLLRAQKEALISELDAEKQKMEELKAEIRSFSVLLSKRDSLLQTLYARSHAMAGNLRAHHKLLTGASLTSHI
ncbi:P-loop containing nucleoside triphosphate hydrolases superfamily protein isoform X2 [Wolffia australiana]